jgi:hypothetical protein
MALLNPLKKFSLFLLKRILKKDVFSLEKIFVE